jgi:hypothetical protein
MEVKSMPAALPEKVISLTQEEAFALLEMCTLTLAAESPAQLQVLSRLGNLCREMLVMPPNNQTVSGEASPPIALCAHPREWLTIACLY